MKNVWNVPEALHGMVRATLMARHRDDKVTQEVSKLTFLERHGVVGSPGHIGRRVADKREEAIYGIPQGTPVANWREWSAVSSEELAVMQSNLGLPGLIPAGCLAEDLLIEGVPNFSNLAPGSTLYFKDPAGNPRTTVLAVWTINRPCGHAAKSVEAEFPDTPNVRSAFVKEAWDIRGLVGFVLRAGIVKPLDRVLVLPP